jgi:hypothetical protein
VLAEQERNELIRLCSNPLSWIVPRWEGVPSRWYPHRVIDDETGDWFTPVGSRDFVQSLVENSRYWTREVMRPPLKGIAYVTKTYSRNNRPSIYIKIQPYGDFLLALSFHYDGDTYPI